MVKLCDHFLNTEIYHLSSPLRCLVFQLTLAWVLISPFPDFKKCCFSASTCDRLKVSRFWSSFEIYPKSYIGSLQLIFSVHMVLRCSLIRCTFSSDTPIFDWTPMECFSQSVNCPQMCSALQHGSLCTRWIFVQLWKLFTPIGSCATIWFHQSCAMKTNWVNDKDNGYFEKDVG